MRKIYLGWMILVFGIVGTAYGSFSLVYNSIHGKELPVYGLILLILGVASLMLLLVLSIITLVQKKRSVSTQEVIDVEPEPVIEEKKEERIKVETPKPEKEIKSEYTPRPKKERVSYSIYDSSTVYVKQVGYGPLLRVDGNRIYDMRNNTYYRIEGNLVKQEGYGPLFEIRGNQIKNAFGGYLYEISGSNINKVYGGFYASISGNYITLFDLSVKYEMSDSLSTSQLLAVTVLLFGTY